MNDDDDIRIDKNQNGVITYVFDPFNPLNISITEKEVQGILKNYGIGVEINNFNLYRRQQSRKPWERWICCYLD